MKTFLFSISFTVWLCAGTLLSAQTTTARQQQGVVSAMDAAYLKDMPTPERVIAEIRGTNELDTVVLQKGAFDQLRSIMDFMMDARRYRGEWAPGEKEVYESYAIAGNRVVKEFASDAKGRFRFPPGTPEREQWERASKHSRDESFRRELVQRYFSPDSLARYEALKKAEDELLNSANQKARAQQQALARKEAEAKALILTLLGFLIAYSALMAFLLYQMFRGPHRLVGPDFNILQSGRKRYHLHSVTGSVVGEVRKSTEVYTYVSGGYNNRPVSTSHSRVPNLEFLLKGTDGRERPIQTRGGLADFVLREGHIVSAVWAVKEGDSQGSYILFRNHTTEVINNASGNLRFLVSNNFWVGVLLAILLVPTGWGLIVLLVLSIWSVRKRAAFIENQISDVIIPRLDRAAAPLL